MRNWCKPQSRPCKLQFEGNPYGYIKRRRRDLFDQPPTRDPYTDKAVTIPSIQSPLDLENSSQDLDLSSVENYLVGRVNTKPKDWFRFLAFLDETHIKNHAYFETEKAGTSSSRMSTGRF